MAEQGWEEVTDPVEIKKALGVDAANALGKGPTGKKLSVQAQNFLNTLSTQAAEAQETSRLYDQATDAINTLRPGPNRGRYLEIATPEEGGGFLDTIGGIIVGGPSRVTGAITPQETDAFQDLRRLQSSQVLGQQLLQKGPQTESDAARLQLTELSPSKSEEVNRRVIASGKAKTDRVRAKAAWYTLWANKYGLNGTDADGNTADSLWAKSADYITQRILHGKPAGFNRKGRQRGGIKVLSRTKVR